MSQRITLRNGVHEVWIAPEAGGSIGRFFTHAADGTVDWLRPADEAAWSTDQARGMGTFPLVPWSNRMRDARTDFGGRPIRPVPDPRSAPHASHGLAWQAPWRVQSHVQAQNHSQAEITLVWAHAPDSAWPYRFDAMQRIRLGTDGALCIDISVTNQDTAPMPAGIGHHCYFPDAVGAHLETEVHGMWTVDAEKMPLAWEPAALAPQLARGVTVGSLDLDHHFTGWSRQARLSWPARGVALEMRATAPLDVVVLYTPAHREFFCVEPVSHCADWMNLAGRGAATVGGHVLAPSQTLEGRLELRPSLGLLKRAQLAD